LCTLRAKVKALKSAMALCLSFKVDSSSRLLLRVHISDLKESSRNGVKMWKSVAGGKSGNNQ